ncbi:IclR family transcriptional regulator [Aliihoeflea sp. 40Bstr573]|uniref:IclR family transcriptional regulator n=1 Tax=Aliihoeflea sp. 40Bstr573 TaxID=2696467 RepID=UPI0020962468|nr:IclR family transcriptional regulator [Aliihoeflea sp. 40Bstr573]MCO6387408.1 helix-turn-helix domain-containing protein [Aliihoeflea sp. 40Bstr573]
MNEQLPTLKRKTSAPRGVQSIDTGGIILKALANARGPLKLRDLAELTDMAAAQLHPYLVSFRKMGMVEQTEAGHYQLGAFALHLGLTRLRNQNAYRETVSRVASLADDLQLMIAVTVWGLHGPTIVYVQESSARIHANVQVGNIFLMTATATGKVFAAYLPLSITQPMVRQERSDRTLLERGPFEFDETRYWDDVERVRARGFETTRDLPIPGVSAVAAPVFDHTGKIQLALTAIGPTSMIDLADHGPAVTGLLRFTRRMSSELGHREPTGAEGG